MDVDRSSYYKWDSKLILSHPNFELNEANYDKEAGEDIAFPSDYTLVTFAKLAYKDKYDRLPQNWALLTTASNKDKRNGYFGVAFFNPKLCQVVVSHRGTELSNPGALLSDAQLALKQPKTRQSQSAATFVHIISEHVKLKRSSNGPLFQLSITGHSLGAWLAQMTTFTVKYLKRDKEFLVEDENYLQNIHAHTVVFESPGCKETLANLLKIYIPRYCHRKFGNSDTLDMTVYLSQLNPINTANRHTGTLYYVVHAKTHSIKEITGLFDQKTHKVERTIILDFRSGAYALCKAFFKQFFSGNTRDKHFVQQPANDNECSLNVFKENEVEFVNDWFRMLQHSSANMQEFKEKNSLPEFKVNYEYNTLTGDNLHKIITRIKRLNPTKQIIYELLQNDASDKLYYAILKIEEGYFKKNLLTFYTHCFKDKYNLLGFLSSDDHILHIRVDKNSKIEYEVETSILYNLIAYYNCNISGGMEHYFRQDQYCFLNCHMVYKVQNFLPRILGRGSNKINLLVIESFEESEQLDVDILQEIHQSNVKTIILTTDEYSWNDVNNVKEVEGFGSDITFQDLTEDCQKDLMTRKLLSLHGKRFSLSDVIDVTFPYSEEFYDRINKTIPVDALLQHLFTGSTKVIMDGSYNDLLSPVLFLDLYEEIEINRLTKTCDDSLFIIQDKESGGLSQTDIDILHTKEQTKIQYDINFKKACHQNFDISKIMYFFTVENGKLFLNTIFNNKFYVPRNIIHKRTVNLRILCNEDLGEYYFLGTKNEFKEMMLHAKSSRKEHCHFVNSEEDTIKQIRNSKLNGHLLKIYEGKLFWLYSHGNIEYLCQYMELNEHSEEEIQVTKRKITVIAGEPGMGKSSTIGYLFLQLQQTHWVFAVQLKHCDFENLDDVVNFDSAAKFVLENSGANDTNLLQHLLSYCLQNATKFPVYLMFDGYDDIYENKYKQKFQRLVNFLKDFSTANILITTRKSVRRELENALSVFASRYTKLKKETEIINFFSCFHYSRLRIFQENINIDDIQSLLLRMWNNVQLTFGETISSFIGMPMQIRMLAEIVTPLDTSTNISDILNDVLGLFKKYIEMRCDIHFRRIRLSANKTIKTWLLEQISEKLNNLAIIKMFNKNIDSIDLNDIGELNRIGLIQLESYNNSQYEFLHDSLCDYFIAYLLKLWLVSYSEVIYHDWDIVEFIVSDMLLRKEFKEVRFFLNSHLKTSPIFINRLQICQKKLSKLWLQNQKLFFSDNQESFFHVCIRENLFFLIKHILIKIVDSSNKSQLLIKRNVDFETPLALAIGTANKNENAENLLLILLEEINNWHSTEIKEILVATLFTYSASANENILKTLEEHSRNYTNVTATIEKVLPHFKQITDFLESCEESKLDRFNNILKALQNDTLTRNYLLQVTNADKKTCLHLTSNREMFERLLKFGANKNIQDHHGMTPLNRAIKEKRTDIATILIRKGALFTTDNINNSPLYHAAKQNNLEIVKLLLNFKKINISLLNDCNAYEVTPLMIAAKYGNENVVQYLLDKGATVSAADWNGMTAVFHAVKGNCTKLIKILREKNAELNIQDRNGITPLLYSIKKERWPMVITLLDNGADINQKSGNEFPLKVLIEKDKKDIIRRVLTFKENITKKRIIKCEAANIEILSETEKEYIHNLQNIP